MLRYIKFEMYVHCSSCEYSMRMYAVVFTLKNDYICYCVLLLHMKIPDHCISYEGVWCAEVVVFHFQRQHKWGACSFLRCCLYTKIYNPPFCSHNRTELGSGPQGTQRSLPLKKTFHLTLYFFSRRTEIVILNSRNVCTASFKLLMGISSKLWLGHPAVI